MKAKIVRPNTEGFAMRKSSIFFVISVLLIISVISTLSLLVFDSSVENENSTSNNFVVANPSATDSSMKTPIMDQETIAAAKSSDDPILKTIHVTHQVLVKKYNVTVTDEEIRDFIKDYYGPMITHDTFDEMKEGVDAQIAAVAAVVEDGVTPQEAAETYLKALGPVENFMPILENADQEKLDKMRKMRPIDRDDSFEKSINGNRDIVEMIKLAPYILPKEKRQGQFHKWDTEYKAALIAYAKENLIGKHPLLMDIKSDQLDISK
jgi:hypothetical protein